MPNDRERLTSRTPECGALGWQVLLSLALHSSMVAFLLMLSQTPRLPDEAEALSVEIVTGPESAEATSQASPPAEASSAPVATAAPAPQADTPPPPPVPSPTPAPALAQAPAVPVPPPQVPPPQVPPPVDVEASAPTPALTVAPPSTPPSPAQQAELPLPTPPPPPPPPAQVAQAHPPSPRPPTPRPPPPRITHASGTGAASAAAAQTQAAASQALASRASAVANGPAWLGRLKQWWDAHSFYPREASLADQGGAVRVRIAIAADGQVTLVQLVGSSGSDVLDTAAQAVFRGARLPPLPPDAVAGPAEVVVTLHYRPAVEGR